jgi:DNA-binding response OmpR family regulator
MKKVRSITNLDHLNQAHQQDRTEEGNTENNENDSLKTKRVMLVEDEADIVLLFKMILKSDVGVKVEQFNDPLAALNNFKSGLYDLIMIDIALPKINGFELYYKIRKLDDRVKVCFLTAGEMYYEDIRKKVVPGLDTNCFIRKPISNEELIKQVKDILGLE